MGYERTFAWLNRYRRLAKDFEDLTRNALAFLRLASIRLMLRKFCMSGINSMLWRFAERGIAPRAPSRLRRYRHRWVHVADPADDQDLLNCPEEYAQELEAMARQAVQALRRTIYENQWV